MRKCLGCGKEFEDYAIRRDGLCSSCYLDKSVVLSTKKVERKYQDEELKRKYAKQRAALNKNKTVESNQPQTVNEPKTEISKKDYRQDFLHESSKSDSNTYVAVLFSLIAIGILTSIIGAQVIFLLIAGVLAIIPASIAQGKGQSFWPWWFYGFFLFIIALIHSIILKEDQISSDNRKLSSGMKKCPYCAEFIRQEAVFCRFCNHELS